MLSLVIIDHVFDCVNLAETHHRLLLPSSWTLGFFISLHHELCVLITSCFRMPSINSYEIIRDPVVRDKILPR